MSETLTANSNISHYRILSKIGAGGMGEVYLAEDMRLNRRVALKVLPADLFNNSQRLHRFRQEAQAASALNHPNIITIHEIGVAGDIHFIATEFIEGETLRRRMQTTRLEVAETLNMATQIAAALDAAHRNGIVHRDIKPENVMLREDGLAKVLDFGLAKLTPAKPETIDTEAPTQVQVNTQAGMILGTVSYMSPEQARGLKVDARTDMFSLGVVLYEMLAGRLPFAGGTTSDVLAAILKTEPAPLDENTPAELKRVVKKMLRKDADERYQTAKDLLIDLKSLQHDLDFTANLERSGIPTKTDQSEPTKEIVHTSSSTEYLTNGIRQHKRSIAVSLAVLLFAVLGFSYWYFSHRASTATQIESIAVLPFINVSGNADVEYLSDGMTESLITSLSHLPKLNVKARSSVFRYKGKEVGPRKVGAELAVQAVLLGRVVQRGNDLTLYIELVDANTENTLWKADYNRPMTNLVVLQSEIARDVATKLRTRLSGAEAQELGKNYTDNAEAYQLYLRGRFYWDKRSAEGLKKAINYFQQAIALDQNYALAYAGLADAYSLLPAYGGAPPHEVMPKAREAVSKALSIDDNLAEAHTARGLILNYYEYDFAGAEREYKRALELNSNYATVHQFYSELLTHLGRHEEAIAEMQRALGIDPLSLIINRIYGESLMYARKYDESIVQFKRAIGLDAGFGPTHFSLFKVYRLKGNYAECVEEYSKSQELIGEPQNAALARAAFAQSGWQGFLRLMTGESRPSNLTPYNAATFHAALGEKDKAFAELNKAYEKREGALALLKVDPRLDPLRNDPRFQDLMRRVGLPQRPAI